MNDAYKEYVLEHPEELVGINELKARSDGIRNMLKNRRNEKLKAIEKCRGILYGKHPE